MYKPQTFCVLLFTLFVFSKVNPLPTNNLKIAVAQKDVESLKQMKEVLALRNQCLVPKDVQDNCIKNALACFTEMLNQLRTLPKISKTASNTISHAIVNLEAILGVNIREIKEKKLCLIGCKLERKPETIPTALDDLLGLLQRMNNQQQSPFQ